jgi:hypothetical protein
MMVRSACKGRLGGGAAMVGGSGERPEGQRPGIPAAE